MHSRLHVYERVWGHLHKFRGLCTAIEQQKEANIKVQKTEVLLADLHGCETWFLPLTEEHKLSVSENKVTRIFRPKKEEVTG